MARLEGRMRRLEAKAKPPLEAVRILVIFVEPDGSESAPHVLVYGGEPRPATAAEIARVGAGCDVRLDPADLNL